MINPWPRPGLDALGLPLVLDHLRTLVAVAVFCWLLISVGRRVLRRWPAEGETAPDALVHGFVVGGGVVGSLMLALGWVGGLGAVPILAVMAALAVWARGEFPEVRGLTLSAVRDPLAGLSGWPRTLLGAGISLGAAFLVARALLPPADWDSIMYHLPIPLGYLGAGAVAIPVDNLAIASTGLLHLMWLPLLLVASPAAVQLFNVVAFGLLLLSVFSAGERLSNRWGGAAACAAMLGTTMLLLVAETARVDTSLALWLWAGQFGVLMLWTRGWDSGWAARIVLALGFAIGVKNQSLAFGLALAPVALWAVWHRAPDRSSAIRRIFAMAAGAAIVGAPWLLTKLAVLGSPLYPMGTERLIQPWLVQLFPPGAGFPPDLLPQGFVQAEGWAALLDFVLAPWRATVESEAAFYRYSPLLLLLPAIALVRRRRTLITLLVPGVIFLLIVVVGTGKSAPRYVSSAFPGLAIGVGIVVAHLLNRAPDRSRRWAFGGTLLITGMLPLVVLLAPLMAGSPVRHLVGLTTPRSTLVQRGLGGLLRLSDRLERVSEGGSIVLIGESRGLYLPRAVHVDVTNNWTLLRRTAAAEMCLQGTEIRHIVVARAIIDFYERALPPGSAWGEIDTFPEFADRCLELISTEDGYELYRVRANGGEFP